VLAINLSGKWRSSHIFATNGGSGISGERRYSSPGSLRTIQSDIYVLFAGTHRQRCESVNDIAQSQLTAHCSGPHRNDWVILRAREDPGIDGNPSRPPCKGAK
jgi:hypothetical protein